MGSPSARLKIRESLRPWIESGLEFVLNPGGVPQEAGGVAEPQAPSVRQQVQQNVNTPSAPPQQAPAQQPQQAASPVRPPQANLPEPWGGFLKFAKPEAKIVWTYMELGLDLGGQTDPKRRAVLKNLQAHLRWPPGTINFWPSSALINGALQPDGRMFWQGWELWRTPSIACFGEEALKVILPEADPSLSTHMLEHVMVYVLPPLAKLSTLLPHEQQMAVDILKNIRA